jgi:hypothetical protein
MPPGRAAGADTIVRVNQVGFVAGDPVRAVVMSSSRVSGVAFRVERTDGARVAGGLIGREGAAWNARYRHVAAITLGEPIAAGTYRIVVGPRRSPPFSVEPANSLYGDLVNNSVRFFTAQRDGPDVVPSVLSRRPSHLADARAPIYAIPVFRGNRPVPPLRRTGKVADVSGGWFDAGDYLKFVETASFAESAMLFALREYPAAFGTGRPAALAEARFGAEWLLRMWDPRTGTLRFQVGLGDGTGRQLGDHDVWTLPQAFDGRKTRPGDPLDLLVHRPVFVDGGRAEVSPNLAGRVAAAFALCAQVFGGSDPALAQRCLPAAKSVFAHARISHVGTLRTSEPHSYYQETEWRDDLEFGAIELYLAGAGTGELRTAARWADAYMRSPLNATDTLNLYDVGALAHYDLHAALLRTPSVSAAVEPADLTADLRDDLHAAAVHSGSDPFATALAYGGSDTAPHLLGLAVAARLYDAMASTSTYEHLATAQLDAVLGANPWGASFVVGAGQSFPRCLHSEPANLAGSLDGRPPLLLGATVPGPTAPSALRGLTLPSRYRPCPPAGPTNPYAAFDGHGATYRDTVAASSTVEPTDDATALALLGFAQEAARP